MSGTTVALPHEILEPKSAADLARAISLLSEGLLTPQEFAATSGVDVSDISLYLTNSIVLAEVQKCTIKLRTSGEAARLEAARHAREAVNVAADIMRDPDMHASSRLNAATFIAKVSGTERPRSDSNDAGERHTITINIGNNQPPLFVDSGIRTFTPDDSGDTQ
jgi:hypothetical protein